MTVTNHPIPIRPLATPPGNAFTKHSKSIQATQKALDALPLNSGKWTVEGVAGLFVRCRAKSKTFIVERRVGGRLVQRTIGELPMREAKESAHEAWTTMRRKRGAGSLITFAEAYRRYITEKKLAPDTLRNYKLSFDKSLVSWHNRSLRDIGDDLHGMRSLQQKVAHESGEATANQVVRLVSCVYNWQRGIDRTLPENPTSAVQMYHIEPRSTAYALAELPAWWKRIGALVPADRMRHIIALLTGARQASISNLRWSDVSLEFKVIKFFKAKRKSYAVPMSDLLTAQLERYQKSGEVPPSPSGWLFPSPVVKDAPLHDMRESPHRLRHSFKTHSVGLMSSEESRFLMGHGSGGDVNLDYVTLGLLSDGLRPAINRLAEKYAKALPGLRV